jgi:sec-independent protein translocase protein TatA
MILLLTLGVLVFGKNLPEVGRSVGHLIAEFRNGMRGVEDSLGGVSTFAGRSAPAPTPLERPRRVAPTAPKFVDAAESAEQAA